MCIINTAYLCVTKYCDIINAMNCMFYKLATLLSWTFYHLVPDSFLYWKMRAYFLQRWLALSSEWWLIIIAGHYFEPEARPGKVNGTYWMHVRADQSAVSATCKEIKHARKKLERENLLAPLWNSFWNSFWLHTIMLSLNLVGLLYFIARIILYKIGWLKFHIKEKYPWRKRKRKKKRSRSTAQH